MTSRLFCIAAIPVVAFTSCVRRDSSGDICEFKRLAGEQGIVGVDTLSMTVQLVHPEVAVVTSVRVVLRPASDTLHVPEIMIYVLADGKWRLRFEG